MSTSSLSIDLQRLEDQIEIARLDQDWNALKSSLQEYSIVFDLSHETSTTYHNSLREMKCFYWICSAEHSFHVTGDFIASIDCLRRAAAFNYSNLEIRILIVRFFLLACRPTIIKYQEMQARVKNMKSLSNFDHENLQLYLYLGDYAKQIPKDSIEQIQSHLDAVSIQERSALINVLATFSNQDVFNVCQEFLEISPKITSTSKKIGTTSSEELFLQFALIISLYLLRPINVGNLLPTYLAKGISTYQYWLFLDGAITRANVQELLLDGKSAQESLRNIVQHVSDGRLNQLPGICCSLVFLAAAKLPVVESRFDLLSVPFTVAHTFQIFTHQMTAVHDLHSPFKAYSNCLLEPTIWYPFLPLPIKVILLLELSFYQLRYLFKEQHCLLENCKVAVKDNGKESENQALEKERLKRFEIEMISKLKQIFINLQQFYFYLRDKTTENDLIILPSQQLESLQFLSNSINPLLPTGYDSNVLIKASLPRTSYLLLILASLLYTVNHQYRSFLTINPDKESNLSNHEYNYEYLEEIFGLVSWAYQIEITPTITILYQLAQIYLITDFQTMRLKAYQLLVQCNEKILLELHRRERFVQKQQSVAKGHIMATENYLPLELFLTFNDHYEVELNECLLSLGFLPAVITRPELCVATLAELMIRSHNLEGSIHDYYRLDKASVESIDQKNIQGEKVEETVTPARELHEVIEIVIHMIKEFYSAIGTEILTYIFHANILARSTKSGGKVHRSATQNVVIASKTQFDSLLGDVNSHHLFQDQSLLHPHPIIKTESSSGMMNDTQLSVDLMTIKDDRENESEFPEIPNYLKTSLERIKRELLSISGELLPGFLLLWIQLGKLFYQYVFIQNRIILEYGHRRLYLQIAFNIFQFLVECLELLLDHPTIIANNFSSFSEIGESIQQIPMNQKLQLLQNFYLLQIESLWFYTLLLAELQAPVQFIVDLVKDVLQSERLQAELSKIYFNMSSTCWDYYENKFLHMMVLLITSPQYSNQAKLTITPDQPEIFAMANSFLQRILLKQSHNEKDSTQPAKLTSENIHQSRSRLNNKKNNSRHKNTQLSEQSYDLSTNYTSMLVNYYAGEKRGTLLKCEELMKEVFKRMNEYLHGNHINNNQEPGMKGSFHRPCLLPIVSNFHLSSRTSYDKGIFFREEYYGQERYQLVRYLLQIGHICFQLTKYSYVKICLLEAWKFLYSIPEEIQTRLDYFMQNLSNVPEEEIIDMMKYIPIPLGEQMAIGGGFQVRHYVDLEAEIFYFIGLLLQYDPSMIISEVSNSLASTYPPTVPLLTKKQRLLGEEAYQYFHFALQIYPGHLKSVLAICNIYIERYLREFRLLRQQFLSQWNDKSTKENPFEQNEDNLEKDFVQDEEIVLMFSDDDDIEDDDSENEPNSLQRNGFQADHGIIEEKVREGKGKHGGSVRREQRQKKKSSHTNYRDKMMYKKISEEALSSGNLASAIFYLEKAYLLDPDHPNLWKLSNLIHQAMGLEERSLESLIISMEKEELLPIRSYSQLAVNCN